MPESLLSADGMRAILGRLTYPGFSFEVADDGFEGPRVRIEGTVTDAFTGQPLGIGIDWWPSPNDRENEFRFLRAMAWRLGRFGNHEAREMLQRDGRPVSDPHADPPPPGVTSQGVTEDG